MPLHLTDEQIDVLDQGVAVYQDGIPRYRNRTLTRLLASEQQDEKLLIAMDRCAGRMTDLLRAARPVSAEKVSTRVRTSCNRYRLAATHLEGGSDARPPLVLVIVRASVPPLPDARELRDRYGLTPREAEIALLLARGLSNVAIAEQLSISRHTARHHAQRALEKIGASSRKALALRLLADREV